MEMGAALLTTKTVSITGFLFPIPSTLISAVLEVLFPREVNFL